MDFKGFCDFLEVKKPKKKKNGTKKGKNEHVEDVPIEKDFSKSKKFVFLI